jgi:hypothetical protein
MTDCLKRQIVLWLLLGGLPLAALANLRRPAPAWATLSTDRTKHTDLPGEQAAGERAKGRARHLPRRLPDVALVQQDWFVSLQGQLRARGVDYVRLEKWHGEPAVYYFECHVPLDPKNAARRGPPPLNGMSVSARAAMQDVLRRVARLAPPSELSRAIGETQPAAAGRQELNRR